MTSVGAEQVPFPDRPGPRQYLLLPAGTSRFRRSDFQWIIPVGPSPAASAYCRTGA